MLSGGSHPHPRRQLPPPPRFQHQFYRPPFPPGLLAARHAPPPPLAAAEHGGVEVHLRHSDPRPGPGPRRPVSELSPRQFYSHYGSYPAHYPAHYPYYPPPPRHPDPASLPRRRLPEIPVQRRLPDTLPRTARPSYRCLIRCIDLYLYLISNYN